MRAFLFSLVCLCGVVLSASCRGGYDPSARFSPDELREDFRVLRRSLEEGHPGLYRHTDKAELDRLFSEAEGALQGPSGAGEFYRVLAPVVAAVRCGHTNVSLPDAAREQNANSVASFPLLVKIVNGRIFVWRDLTERAGPLAGREILSVNGVPAARLLQTMLAGTGGDGHIRTSRIKRVEEWNFVEGLTPLTGLGGPFELAVLDPGTGREGRVRLDGLGVPALRRNWAEWFPRDQRPARAGEMEFLDGGGVGRMTLREFGGFVDDERKRGLAEFYREAFGRLAARKTGVLILDLRDNGGGDDRLGTLLLSHLLAEPFEHYREIVAKQTSFTFGEGLFGATRVSLPYKAERRADNLYHLTDYPNLGLLQPSAPTFSGKIYVLMNGGSFSTTAEVISQLRSRGRAEFVGQEAGGAYDGNNSGTIARVVLPNTRLVLQVPLMSYYLAVRGGPDNSRGVAPDHPVEYSVADYLTNADREMALALELARRAPVDTPGAAAISSPRSEGPDRTGAHTFSLRRSQ